MKNIKFLLLCFLGVVFTVSAAIPTPSSTTTYNLATGVIYRKYVYASTNPLYGRAQNIFVLEVNLGNPALEVGIGICNNNVCQNTATQGAKNGAIAAVNLGFFAMATPSDAVGVLKYQGKLFKANIGSISHVTEGFFWVDGGRAGMVPPNQFSIGSAANVRYGYPLLVTDGAVYPPLANFTGSDSIVTSRRARTALGVDAARQTLYMVVVDEVSGNGQYGVTCKELADFMIKLGCNEAFNADGGGSSTMWTQAYGLMNRPQNGTYQRPVYDVLFVRTKVGNYNETNTSNPSMPDPGDETLLPKDER